MGGMTPAVTATSTIALTGAGGRLGWFLQQALGQAAYAVHPLDRQVHGDLTQTDFRPFLAGCSALIHAAFDHIPGKYRGGEGDDPIQFWDRNFQSTLRFLEQAREVGVQRVVLFSSRAIYGSHQQFDAPIDEGEPAQPDSHYGAIKGAIERLAPLYTDAKMQVTVLRPTGIYGGPMALNKWGPMVREAGKGRLPTTNKTATEVHGATVAQAAIMALTDPENRMAGQVFNLSEVKVTTAQILTWTRIDTAAMPPAKPMQGPELSSQRLQDLGLRLSGDSEIEQCARQLAQYLRQGSPT